MRKIRFIIWFSIIFITAGQAQFYEQARQSGAGMPYFEAEIFRTFTEDHRPTRLYIYTEILFDDLTFIRESSNSGFKAQLELLLALLDKDDQQVGSKSITRTIYETDYNATNSRDRSILMSHYFDVPYGEYQIKIKMNDEMSKKTISGKVEVILNDYPSQKLALSDLLLLNALQFDSTGKVLNRIPRVKSNFPKKEGNFFVEFDLYSNLVPRKVKFNYKLIDDKDGIELDSTFTTEVQDTITTYYFDIAKYQLKKNHYTCVVKVEGDNYKTESSKKVSFYWVTVPETSEDITMAINQMRYILPGDSLDRYLEAPLVEQQRFFKNFWANRDPNPNTLINELMEEYFSRINYANREFSNFNSKGWLSDRGRIIVKFGYPDDVERHPFEINSVPYEIWRFYSLRKVFVFADENGFGEYRLLPQYMSQEY